MKEMRKKDAAAVLACLPSKFNSFYHVEQEVSVEVRAQEENIVMIIKQTGKPHPFLNYEFLYRINNDFTSVFKPKMEEVFFG